MQHYGVPGFLHLISSSWLHLKGLNNKIVQKQLLLKDFKLDLKPSPNNFDFMLCLLFGIVSLMEHNTTLREHVFTVTTRGTEHLWKRPEGGIGIFKRATKWTMLPDCFLRCCFQGQEPQLLGQCGQELYLNKKLLFHDN